MSFVPALPLPTNDGLNGVYSAGYLQDVNTGVQQVSHLGTMLDNSLGKINDNIGNDCFNQDPNQTSCYDRCFRSLCCISATDSTPRVTAKVMIAMVVIVGLTVGIAFGVGQSNGTSGTSNSSGGDGGDGGGNDGEDSAASSFGSCSSNSCMNICDSSEISCNYCQAACVFWVCGDRSDCSDQADNASQLGLACSSLGITCT